jgi:hypothetical protein
MTRERHLLGHLIFQTNEGDVAVASKQSYMADFTGTQQHTQSKITVTAGLIIQSKPLRVVNLNKYAVMASIDLTNIFPLVNIRILIKLRSLVKGWKDEMLFYLLLTAVLKLRVFKHYT